MPVLFGLPILANSAPPMRDDVLHVAERLDVVDDRRALIKAEHGREIRRLDPRISALAFERFDQPGLLAADVSARAAMHVDLAVETRAENVLAEETAFARASASAFSRICAPSGKLAADVDIGELRADREARDDHPFEQLMRILMNDVAILERARLRLVRVANQIDRLRPARA